MATIASLIVDVAANTAKLTKDVEDIHGKLDRVSSIAGTVGKALSAAFTVTAIIGATKQVLDHAGALTDLAAKTGISTTGLQKFDLAFKQSGISLDTVTGAVTKLANNIVGGNKSAVGALEQMGLSVTALKNMAPEQQFTTVADAIGKIPNPTERAYAAMQVFGKGGAELLAGMDGHLAETTQRFEDMGLVMSAETVAAADEFGDQLGMMGSQLMALVATIIGPLLPALSGLLNLVMKIGQAIGPVIAGFLDFAQRAIMTLVASVMRFLATLGDLATRIPLLGKHLGFAGDAANWLRESASDAERYVANLGASTVTAGTTAAVAAPKLVGFGKAASDTATHARAAAKEIDAMARQLERAHEMERGSDMVVSFGFDPATIKRQFDQAFQPEQMYTLGAKVGSQVSQGIFGTLLPSVTQHAPTVGATAGGGILSGLSGLFKSGGFTSVVTGLFSGGGIANAITGGLSQAIGMGLNAIVPGLGALAGPLMAGVRRLWSGIRSLFGGPSAEEMGGRNAASEFKSQVESMLSDAQRLELSANNVSGAMAQQVALHIAIRDAAKDRAVGEQQASQLVQRLWAAEKAGPEAVKRVIEEINDVLRTATPQAVETAGAAAVSTVTSVVNAGMTAAQQLNAALQRYGVAAFVSGGAGQAGSDERSDDWVAGQTLAEFVKRNGVSDITRFAESVTGAEAQAKAANEMKNFIADHPGLVSAAQQAKRENDNTDRYLGFATGTGGRFMDFGAGTNVTLHGRERVVTEAEGRAESLSMAALRGELAALRADFRMMPKWIAAAVQTA